MISADVLTIEEGSLYPALQRMLVGDEARATARRRMGDPLRLRDHARGAWTFPTIETLARPQLKSL